MFMLVTCLVGHSAVVALLLENGAEYSVSDSNGATPLHYAAQNNHHVSWISQPTRVSFFYE